MIVLRYMAIAVHKYIQRTKAESTHVEELIVFVCIRIWGIFILFFFISRFFMFSVTNALFLSSDKVMKMRDYFLPIELENIF